MENPKKILSDYYIGKKFKFLELDETKFRTWVESKPERFRRSMDHPQMNFKVYHEFPTEDVKRAIENSKNENLHVNIMACFEEVGLEEIELTVNSFYIYDNNLSLGFVESHKTCELYLDGWHNG
jgi:hypothetical protein